MKPTLQAVKISDTIISVEKVTPEVIIPEKTEQVQYERKFIEGQIEAITKQRDEMISEKENLIALKEAELKECQDILAKMDELGIIVKPVEVVEEVLPVEEIVK